MSKKTKFESKTKTKTCRYYTISFEISMRLIDPQKDLKKAVHFG